MPFLTNKQDIQHTTVIALFRGLDSTLPGIVGQASMYVDQDPEVIGSHLGKALASEFNLLQHTIITQEAQLEAQGKNLCCLLEQNHASPTAAMVRELESTKEEIEDLQKQLGEAQQMIETLKRQSALANAQHAKEVEHLQEMLAEYKSLNARQHLELVDLMGESYTQSQPPAELPG